MTLSLLKTHDLTWQDRTVNMELMRAPHRSRMLFNKHKSLSSSYNTEVDLYEKQAVFLRRDIAVETRLLEKYRSKLVSRQKELVVQRSQSAQEMRKVELLTLKDRSRSAPAGAFRGSSPPPCEGRRSRGVFLTEITEDRTSKLPTLASIMSKKKRQTQLTFILPKPVKKRKPPPKPVCVTFPRKTYVTFGVRAPSQATESDTTSEAEDEPEVKDDGLSMNVKIQNFMDEVKAFNKKPAPLKRCPGTRDLFAYLKKNEKNTDSLVAKRYDTFSLDRQKLEDSFDAFCKTKSREDLSKMMRLAVKMKANIAQARNSSLMPTLAVIKSTRVFLSLKSGATQDKENNTPALKV